MKSNDIAKNRDVLIQIKLKNFGEYDIIKCVYKNLDTFELFVVELVKESKEFDNKEFYLDEVFCDSVSSIEFIDNCSILRENENFVFLQNKYNLQDNCIVYYSKKRGRLCTWVDK